MNVLFLDVHGKYKDTLYAVKPNTGPRQPGMFNKKQITCTLIPAH